MKALKLLSTGIAIVTFSLTPAALADKYDDLVKKGYRWAIVDGPYAAASQEDLRQTVRDHSEANELQFIEQLRAYYLLPGSIVQVIQQDATSGVSEIQLDGVTRPLWTLTRFLSLRPIPDVYGELESPFEVGTTLNKPIGTSEGPQQPTVPSVGDPTSFSGR